MSFNRGDKVKWKPFNKVGVYFGATRRTANRHSNYPLACVQFDGKNKTNLIPINQLERLET